jgi:hypothetical protein
VEVTEAVSDNQIEQYERPYRVVFGEDGGDATPIPGPSGPDFPIWRARRWVVAVIQTQVEKLPESDEREALDIIQREFNAAQTGDLVFGMIRRWTNRSGKRRFIGITPSDKDYREAGKSPVSPASNHQGFTPPPVPPRPKPVRQMSDAERIADKMAKAARKAVEGEQ